MSETSTNPVEDAKLWAQNFERNLKHDDPAVMSGDALRLLIADLRRVAETCERAQDERDEYARSALVGLAGLVPTPEKGYVADGGPGQLAADFRKLRARVAELERVLRGLLDERTLAEAIRVAAADKADAALARATGEGQ